MTLVAWGDTTEVCLDALRLTGDAISADFFDLRSIVPWDREALAVSLAKTGRLVVVQEDTENCSVGQMIIASLAGNPEVWSRMKAPPALVSKGNVMIGYNPVLEFAALPNAERVAAALRAAMSGSVSRGASATLPRAGAKDATAPSGAETAITVPILGEGIRQARVVSLLKNPGDAVALDDPLCELETDKAVYPVESSQAGTMGDWNVAVGESVEIGARLGAVQVHGGVPVPVRSAAASLAPALSPAITRRLGQVVPVYLTVNAKWEAIRSARRRGQGTRRTDHAIADARVVHGAGDGSLRAVPPAVRG